MQDTSQYFQCLGSGRDKNNRPTPDARTYFIFHHVLSGGGFIQINDKCYPVCAGQTFFIPHYVPVAYWSETDWEYVWVNFSGPHAEELLSLTAFSENVPVCTPPESPLPLYEQITSCGSHPADRCRAVGLIIQLLSVYIACHPSGKGYLKDNSSQFVLSFTQANMYRTDISVETLADMLGISRVTLYRKFMEEVGVSPADYIHGQRMRRAKELLSVSRLPIRQVALAVGYSDPLYFSSVFRRFRGCSPSAYRKEKQSKK